MTNDHSDINVSDSLDRGSRLVLRALFAEFIPDIAETAVPVPNDDHHYAPVVLQALDAADRPVGGVLACRPQIAVAAHMARAMPNSPTAVYTGLLDRVVFLDMIAVRPEHRNKGIASSMLAEVEERLRVRGATVLFGKVTDGDAKALSAFYRGAGFTVLTDGQALPPFLGLEWTMPNEPAPRFWFYKKLAVRAA